MKSKYMTVKKEFVRWLPANSGNDSDDIIYIIENYGFSNDTISSSKYDDNTTRVKISIKIEPMR